MATLLPEPNYTDEEKRLLLTYVADLKKDVLREFLRERSLPVSGNKDNLMERVEEALHGGYLTHSELVSLLDTIEPWDKQHVVLLDGPRSVDISAWKNRAKLEELLKRHKLGYLLDRKVPLILPERLKIASIEHQENRFLRITAVERRVSEERQPDEDETKEEENQTVIYRAYVRIVTRGLITFEWDFQTNTAMLRVSQLPSGNTYEEHLDQVRLLLHSWLDLHLFTTVRLAQAIRTFHAQEASGKRETRSHGIDYDTPAGRRFGGRSASVKQVLLGEELYLDAALDEIRSNGAQGRLGNFYFLPLSPPIAGHPLEEELHVMLLAGKQNRINFMTASKEPAIRHVLQRIRAAC